MAGQGETPEAQAFREFFDTLTKAITHPEGLATTLYSKGLIFEQARDEVFLPAAIESKKTSVLLGVVEKTVGVDPKKMDTLIGVLRKIPPLEDVARKLDQRVTGTSVIQPARLRVFNLLSLSFQTFAG